ncbi:MAG: GAF domain-containing protein [Chloroflexi bacterium]|nr:GAF domain-containing protein [Chloroflexota bacterium]
MGAVLVFRDITVRKRVEEERERQLRETLLLNRVIATATSMLDVNAILQTICNELATFFDLPQAAFALLDKSEAYLRVVAEYLEEGRIPALGTIIPLQNNPATQEVLQTRKPLIIPDAQTDPRQPALHEIARLRGTRSVLVVPLLVRGQVLGTLGLNARENYEFAAADVELAQNVASAASQALSNAELYTAVQQELAERRRAEEALAQARDKALEASKLKSELIAKVSHELRTPLASILGFAEMLQLGIYGSVTAEQEETLGKVLQSTEVLVTMVNDLLDLAQLEAGTFKVAHLPFEPSALVSRMESTMRIIAQAKGLTLTSTIHADLPTNLLGDGDRLHQILLNLVSNAVKFTENGGVQVHLFPLDEAQWVMSVRDSGPGIPLDMQPVIFDEFRQVDFSPTRRYRGVGLGLSIVKQIVTAMHGTVRVESELGQGSAFIVTLPLARDKEQ